MPFLSYKTPYKTNCTCSGITGKCSHGTCGASEILPFLYALFHLLCFIQLFLPRFAAIRTWSPISWVEVADLRAHLAWSLGCIQADTFWGWYSRVSNTILKCILFTWMVVSHMTEVAITVKLLMRISHWWNSTLLDRGILFNGKNLQVVLSQLYKEESPWLLSLAQEDMRYKQIFSEFQCHNADFCNCRTLEETAKASVLRM